MQYLSAAIGSRRYSMRRRPVGPAHPVAVGHRRSSQIQYASATIGSRRHCMRRLPSGPAHTVCVGYHRVPQINNLSASRGIRSPICFGCLRLPHIYLNLGYQQVPLPSWSVAPAGTREFAICWVPLVPTNLVYIGGWWLPHPSLSQ